MMNLKKIARHFVLLLVVAGFTSGAASDEFSSKSIKVQGWQVIVRSDLVGDHLVLDQMLDKLTDQLTEISLTVPNPQLDSLRATPIWLVGRDPYADEHDLAGLYYFSEQWLLENGYTNELAKSVLFTRRFGMEEAQNIVFHELSHSFHDQVLGLENERVIQLYQEVRFDNVNARDRCPREGGVYAFSNVDEFFATFSQAYFGGTCAYPNNRNIIRLMHPEVYQFLQEVWGF